MAVINLIKTFLSKNATLLGPLVLLIMLVVFAALGKDLFIDVALQFERAVDGFGTLGYVIFVGIFFIAALSGVFPLSVLAALAGMLFGLSYGFVLAAIGIFSGAIGAFILGRYVFRSTVERWLEGRMVLSRLDEEIGEHGWKIVGLLRLSPFAPFSISSYAFSMTRITFGAYVAGTFGVLPPLFALVYTGSISSVALNAFLHGKMELNGIQMTVIGAGFLATVLVALLLVRLARRALINHQHD